MTDRPGYTSETDGRADEKPPRSKTLGNAVPPAMGTESRGLVAVAVEYLPRIKVGRLETVEQWRRLVGKIMRAMVRGEIPLESGTKLMWAARVGVDITKVEQEQRTLDELNGRLARLESDDAGRARLAAGDLTDEELQESARRGRLVLESQSGPENEL